MDALNLNEFKKHLNIDKAEVLENYICSKCNRTVTKTKIIYKDGKTSVKETGCVCRQIEEATEVKRLKDVKKYHTSSIMPKDHLTKKVNNYHAKTDSQKYAKEVTTSFIMNSKAAIEAGQGILYKGDFGTGKTHLALAIRNYLEEKEKKVLFVTLPDYLERIKEGYNGAKDTRALQTSYNIQNLTKTADLLILDDVGANNMTKWAIEQLFMLVNARKGKSTIYTTNLTTDEFIKDKDLHRIYSRMTENNREIEIYGEDKRKNTNDFKF